MAISDMMKIDLVRKKSAVDGLAKVITDTHSARFFSQIRGSSKKFQFKRSGF